MPILESLRGALGPTFGRAWRSLRSNVQDDRERVAAYRAMFPFEPWCLDYVHVAGADVEIKGWAIAPGGTSSAVTLAVNGRPFNTVKYPTVRKDLGELYWYLPHAKYSGFEARTPADPDVLTSADPLVLQCVNRKTGVPFREEHAYYFNSRSSAHLPVPDGGRMRRVHGGDQVDSFLLEGYSTFVKLDRALTQYTGRRLQDCARILDWGCGCGRLIRHLSGLPPGTRIAGCDIDVDNVNWCRQHLPFADYFDLPLHTPTPLPAGAFDLIVGISVFTHLKEKDQDDWLAELKRVSAPGAVLLVTVHGNAAASRQNWPLPILTAWQQHGFIDGTSHDLDGFIEDADYYRNACHTADYVRRHWGRFFEVVTIVEGYIGNFQDLVILRVPAR